MDEDGGYELLRSNRRHDPLRHHRSPGGFKGVELNAVGWGALAGSGLVAGALGTLAGAPAKLALPAGVVAAWATALTIDHLRWRDKTTGMGTDGLDAATGAEIVARLRELGVDATYREFVDEYEGEVYTDRSIVCRNADLERVQTVMDDVLRR